MSMHFWLAFLAYLLPTFPLGYFWHLSTFKHRYDRLEMYRDNVIIPMGLGSMILQGLLFAYLYPKLFSTAPEAWMSSAAGFFVVFGLMAWSFVVLPVAAKYRTASVAEFFMLETAFTIVQFLITAPLIALAWRDASP